MVQSIEPSKRIPGGADASPVTRSAKKKKHDHKVAGTGVSDQSSVCPIRLPPEIVQSALQYLEDDGPALRQAQAVNRTWYLLVTPVLYGHYRCTAQELAFALDFASQSSSRSTSPKPQCGSLSELEGPGGEAVLSAGKEGNDGEDADAQEEEEERGHPMDWPVSQRYRYLLGYVRRLAYCPVRRYYAHPPGFDTTGAFTLPRLRELCVDLSQCDMEVQDYDEEHEGEAEIPPVKALLELLGIDRPRQSSRIRPRLHRICFTDAWWVNPAKGELNQLSHLAPHLTLHYFNPWDGGFPPLSTERDGCDSSEEHEDLDRSPKDTHSITIDSESVQTDRGRRGHSYFSNELQHVMQKGGLPWKIRNAVIERPNADFVDWSADEEHKTEEQKDWEASMVASTLPNLIEPGRAVHWAVAQCIGRMQPLASRIPALSAVGRYRVSSGSGSAADSPRPREKRATEARDATNQRPVIVCSWWRPLLGPCMHMHDT